MKFGSLFLLVCCIVIDNCEAQNINPYYPTSASLLRSPSSLLSIGGFGGGLGGGDFLPEDSVTALGDGEQLIRIKHIKETQNNNYVDIGNLGFIHHFKIRH